MCPSIIVKFDPSIPETYHALYQSVIESARSSSLAMKKENYAFKEKGNKPERHDTYFFYHWVKAIPSDPRTDNEFKTHIENNGYPNLESWRKMPAKGFSSEVFAQSVFEISAKLAQRTVFQHLIGYIKYAQVYGANLFAIRNFKPQIKELLSLADQSQNQSNSHDIPSPEQLATRLNIVRNIPDDLQNKYLDKINKKEILVSELQEQVSVLEKKIDDLLKDENITEEIRLMIEAGRLDEAEIRVDEIIATKVAEERKKHGEYFYQQGAVKELKLKFQEAYESSKQAIECQPDNITYLSTAGIIGTELAVFSEAKKHLDQALTLSLNSEDGADLATAICYDNIAENLSEQGKLNDAFDCLSKALNIRLSLCDENDIELAESYNRLAHCLSLKEEFRSAEPHFRKALEILWLSETADTLEKEAYYRNNLGSCLNNQLKHDEAKSEYIRAYTIHIDQHGECHPVTANSFQNYAITLSCLEEFEDSFRFFYRALNIFQNVYGDRHADTANCYHNLARSLFDIGEVDEAGRIFKRAYDLSLEVLGEKHPSTGGCAHSLGHFHYSVKNFIEAEEFFKNALHANKASFGENHLQTINSGVSLAYNLHELEKYDAAEQYLRKAVVFFESEHGDSHEDTVTAYSNLAMNLHYQGKHGDADPIYKKSYELHLRIHGEADESSKYVWKRWQENTALIN